MAALFARPRRRAGLYSAATGLGGLVAFYSLLFWRGQYDPNSEIYVWRIGGIELWQDYAVLCTVPISFVGLIMGNLFGEDER
jgi:hypothetical protein